MKMICSFLLALLMLMPCAHAIENVTAQGAEFALNKGAGIQKYQLGTLVTREKVWNLKLQYSFANQGGAIGVISPWGPVSHSPKLPLNGIIMGCYIEVITAPTSGGAATIALSSGKGAGDLLAATAYTSFTAGSILACIPTGSAASAIKLVADTNPTITVAGAALTAGVFNVHVMYLLGGPQ